MRMFLNNQTQQIVMLYGDTAYSTFNYFCDIPQSQEFADRIIEHLSQSQYCACKEIKVPAKVKEYANLHML